MPDDSTHDELEPGEGKVLPQREMMSLVSTDPVPVDPVAGIMVPGDTPDGPALGAIPVEPETE